MASWGRRDLLRGQLHEGKALLDHISDCICGVGRHLTYKGRVCSGRRCRVARGSVGFDSVFSSSQIRQTLCASRADDQVSTGAAPSARPRANQTHN